MQVSIHPSIGVARLGNSKTEICLSPDSIGGLPYDADSSGNLVGPISTFKDADGRIKRQGQPFKIYDELGVEVTLDHENVISMEWTVHLANKKAAWYQYSELQGNLLYGDANSYANQGVPFRNGKTPDRQTLIVDPGPRSISGRNRSIEFDETNVPDGYPAQFPPSEVLYGTAITSLGTLLTDDKGRLIVLGGYGNAGGNAPLTSYGGSDTWHDDISDGYVTCMVTFKEPRLTQTLSAWIIVGSPDFAPEIVNISNLSDTMFDVGVRNFDLVSDMYSEDTYGGWNTDYVANFQRDILPIINRISRYQWVANVQSMMAFASNIFDFSDNSSANKQNRQNYYSYFRQNDDQPPVPTNLPQEQLFTSTNSGDMFPMMPLNSGSNSVSNINIQKFLALDATQLFLLGQWAEGNFVSDPNYDNDTVNSKDQAAVGNCVGLPMCPGIEVTWNLQNPIIYNRPYVIEQYGDANQYQTQGLTPSRDECSEQNDASGCEPGDLTKRMACPWQADFFQCTIQYINFTNPSVNKEMTADGGQAPLPPTYYTYWWPPQSPWDVLVGEFTESGQALNHVPAGQQMNYARGINSFSQMVEHWSALGFIRDLNNSHQGFPYMVETERENALFSYKDVPVGDITGNDEDNETTIPVFYIEEKVEKDIHTARGLMHKVEKKAFKKIKIVSGGLGMPRSGTKRRR
ncbi:MAG: CTQ-dependent lysine 6-oxidase LodA [Saprospiraceae bacterium]